MSITIFDIVIIVLFVLIQYFIHIGSDGNTGEKMFLTVLSIVVAIFIFFFGSLATTVDKNVERIPKKSYKVEKDETHVVFLHNGRTYTSNQRYIYKYAEDTSRVWLEKELIEKRAGDVRKNIYIETDIELEE